MQRGRGISAEWHSLALDILIKRRQCVLMVVVVCDGGGGRRRRMRGVIWRYDDMEDRFQRGTRKKKQWCNKMTRENIVSSVRVQDGNLRFQGRQ